MNAEKLLKELHSRGVSFAVEAGRLCVDAPNGMLSKALTDEIRVHKAELINLLTSVQPTGKPLKAVPATDQSERKRTKKETRSWIYDMPSDASDFEWWVEFIANCETHPLKSYENAQRVEEEKRL